MTLRMRLASGAALSPNLVWAMVVSVTSRPWSF